MTDAIAHSFGKNFVPWACVAGAFAVWLAAVAAMTVLPQEHAAAERIAVPTGLLVLHQDRHGQHSVPVREVRPL